MMNVEGVVLAYPARREVEARRALEYSTKALYQSSDGCKRILFYTERSKPDPLVSQLDVAGLGGLAGKPVSFKQCSKFQVLERV